MVGTLWRAAAAAVVLVSWSATSLAADPLKAGRELYQAKQYPQALEQLEAARREKPNDPEAALLLGLTLIRLDMPDQAAAAWADYQRLSKDKTSAEEIARLRTILLREAAARSAQKAVAEEKQLAAATADPKTVAVSAFRGLGTPEIAPLGKAIAAMLIADLSAIPNLHVLERERVEALAQEAKLAGSGLVDKRTAVRVGKLLRAGRVVSGSYTDWTASPAHLRIQSVLLNAEDGAELSSSSAEGMLTEFYVLVPQTATAVAAGLDAPVAKLPPETAAKVQQSHTKSLPAVLAFGRGLDLKDSGDYAGARAEFETAVKEDPNFELARRELSLLPASLLSLAAVATTAEAAIPAAGGGLSLTSPAVLAGGAILVAGAIGGGIAAGVSGGGGGGGSSSASTNPHPPTLEGVENSSVQVGDTVTLQITGSDPDGTRVELKVTNPPPGSTFTPVNDRQAHATFSWTPTTPGTSTVTFTATDNGNPKRSTTRNAVITVSQGTPTTSTTIGCLPLGSACDPQGTCCVSDDCAFTPAEPTTTVCCTGFGKPCGGPEDCCGVSTTCTDSVCCIAPGASGCVAPTDCCSGASCDAGCCLLVGLPCQTSAECCNGFCDTSLGCQPGSGP
jgi:tetratricopeptide (TPR) repeat protein